MKNIITGVKPTGEAPHIGNLVGAILPFREISERHDIDAALFIADMHALTSVFDAETLKKNTRELALTYFAIFGLDTKVQIFRQSDIPLIPKLNWILNTVTPYSLMLRAHSFKDSQAKNHDLNMGVFNYPILMAADIIGYDIDLVPVGDDQRQHLEMTRDIAKSFNKTYRQDIFRIPKEVIDENVATIPGLDGRKMSKSYRNFIGIFDDDATLKKKVMSIVTDSKGVDEPKDPDVCVIFALIRVFGSSSKVEEIRQKYLAGGFGYGHAKLELLEILKQYIAPYRARREELASNYGLIEQKLMQGAEVMNQRIRQKMEEVRLAVGI